MSPVRQWPVCRRRRRAGLRRALTGRPPRRDVLSLHDSGSWALASSGSGLHLIRAWPAFAWMTLRFRHGAGPGGPLELTVWKRGLPDGAWRELRICVARQLALPQRSRDKEPA